MEPNFIGRLPAGKQMTITTLIHGVETSRDAPVPKESMARAREFENWLKKAPFPGSKFINYSTEWAEEPIDQEEITTIRGKKKHPLGRG